ncbi:MAG: hypothetical protein FWD53_03215 [Phycisphaerales bacterium]|nr:hypothetical protein [Phycisphaerales bacterium]
MMTRREMMLRTIGGLVTSELPWAPRLDLWYLANRRAGTLPREFRNATLRELVDGMGWGYHAIVPNFLDVRGELDSVDRGLGIYNLWMMPGRTVLENVRRHVERDGDLTRVSYETPMGTIRTEALHDESMRAAGVTISHITEYAIKSPADFAALGYIFENARVEANYAGYEEYADHVGGRGVAAGFVSLAGSPMHLIVRELMPFDQFYYALYDAPDELTALAEKIGGYWRRMMEVACGCAAEIIFVGANYDAAMTYPPFFAEHIKPWLQRYAAECHGKGGGRGKYLLTHVDGENTGLLDHYLDCGFDIADSICPSPMTKLTLREVREKFARGGGKITIMGGVPSVALLGDSMSDREFERFLDSFFADLGDGSGQILGVSDTTPPAAKWERLVKIGERAREFGNIAPR